MGTEQVRMQTGEGTEEPGKKKGVWLGGSGSEAGREVPGWVQGEKLMSLVPPVLLKAERSPQSLCMVRGWHIRRPLSLRRSVTHAITHACSVHVGMVL